MKALLLNGSRKDDDSLDAAHKVIVEELHRAGCEVDAVILHDTKIADCLGCFKCWIKTPGVCATDDAGRDVARKMIQSDLLVFLTPVTFGGYSSELKKAVDRFIPNISPFFTKVAGETHHKKRYERYPRWLSVGVLPRPDEESEQLFRTLVRRNAINLYSPVHAAGVLFSTQGTDEIRAEVKTLLAEVEVGK